MLSPCAAFVSGCEQPQTIATYTVARTAPPSPPFPISQVDQILVAVVPQADKAWFFKLNGKKPAVERQRQAFDAFVSTVQLAANSAEKPRWDLPDGWTEKAATEMRVATLKVPDVDGDLDLAVSSLPLTGDWEDFLVPNVNRWLNQLQCSRMTKPEVLELAEQIPAAEATATVFHLAGLKPVEQTIGNPHAGLGIPPPATAQQPASAAPRGGLKYDKPAEWLPGKMSMMRKAAACLPARPSAVRLPALRSSVRCQPENSLPLRNLLVHRPGARTPPFASSTFCPAATQRVCHT
ncbi:MAG: hypothetical protein AAGD11_20725 [Planctomycetota bacterium]